MLCEVCRCRRGRKREGDEEKTKEMKREGDDENMEEMKREGDDENGERDKEKKRE